MQRLLENIAAISAEFHSGTTYQQFYADHGESLNGFPGIWAYMVKAAHAFTEVEVDEGWIEAVASFADELSVSEPLDDNQLKELARKHIARAESQ